MDKPRGRPDPDELLRSLSAERGAFGHLKVFLGASAGVGKTYSMLSEAQQQKQRGKSVVIGVVETHGRAETQAQMEGLSIVPMITLDYRGTKFYEPDVEAIIEQMPDLVLIDELAHTNAPGSRHAKRWQDVEELLKAGINVYTAVNIQHLETLNDVVEQVTGVRVQETVPDAFLEQASEVELIDIPPAELQQRLREGKVYVPDRIQHALEGFFKTSNLTALRELALRRTADTVDAEMQRLRTQEGVRTSWATRERVVVCIAPNRLASRVVRSAARLGAASHAELIAVYVESDRQTGRTTEQHAAAQDALRLAEELGMEVVNLQGHDIVTEIVDFANRRNATLIVVGKPVKARWKEIISGSVVDELVRASGDIDVHVITAAPEVTAPKARAPLEVGKVSWPGIGVVALSTAAATGLGFALFEGFGIANVAMIYLLFVAISAMRITQAESAISAVVSVLTFNFFFVEPRFTFAVSDARYTLVFLVMLTVGLVVSTLTHRLRSQLLAASERERRTASLYALTRQLAQGRSKRDLAKSAADEIRSVFEADVAIFLTDHGRLTVIAPSETGFEKLANEGAVASWVAEHGEPAGLGTDTLPGASALCIPLRGADSVVGLIAFKPNQPNVSIAQRQLLDTFANGLGLALERAVLAKESNDARIQAESERIRSTLLSSISHDLRTPLTSITGAASSLVEGQGDSAQLAMTIYSESVRLNHQIQNLLDMTRLQSGAMNLDYAWHAPSELIASALRNAKSSLGERTVTLSVPEGLPLIRVDGLLIEKAIINLLENAGRHTRPSDSVRISARSDGKTVTIEVSDNGPGLGTDDLNALFKPGYRTPAGGYGLGLAVVKAVCDLHGGEVQAMNASGGGAVFDLLLPVPADQPEVPIG